MTARIRNVSRTGVNVIVSKVVLEGTMIRIDLPVTKDGPHTTVLACVTNSRETAPGEWSLGCMFSLELSDAEMRALGGEKTAPADPADQRAWVRYPAQGTVAFRMLPGEVGSPQSGELIDLSPAGVGLLVDQKVEPGSALTVTLRRNDNKPDRTMLVCVVYLTDRPDGKWAVGCQFLHELTEKELQELVWRSTS
jgi:hypothetical protein